MTLCPYGQYKTSAFSRIGSVPEHWSIRRFGSLESTGSDFVSGPFGSSLGAGDYAESGIPVIRGLNTTLNAAARFVADELVYVNDGKFQELRRCDARPGDLVFTARGTVGKVGIVPSTIDRALISPNQLRYRPNHPQVSATYLYYQFAAPSLRAEISLLSDSVAQPNLNLGSLRSLVILLPPLEEQLAIGTFLDRETAKIDELVAEQRRLIELLKEKRQAVISHAVTKGLNPDAPLKPSGIEWLGDVPEHWRQMPIRYAARLESGHTPSRSRPDWWENCKHPWISLSDVWQIRDGISKYIISTKEKVSDLGLENSAARLLPKGTVVLSRTASVGFAGIMGGVMATTQDFANWVCGERLSPEYLLFVFRAMGGEFERLKYGSTHNTIYMPDIAALRFALPPLEEQDTIVRFVDESLNGFDDLIAEANLAVELLQERRTALISAAVTGKIDVRGLAATEAA